MKRINYLFFLLLLFIPNSISARSYDITNRYVEVEISDNNVYSITEYYNVYFKDNGSFRKIIPKQIFAYNNSGKKIPYITEISDITSENKINISKTKKYDELTFESMVIDSNITYLLSYNYNMGKDLDKNNDIVLINLTDEYNKNIDLINFSIRFKQAVEIKDVEFYIDGKKAENMISYSSISNIITGDISSDVSLDKNIALQIILEDGYFKNEVSTTSYIYLLYLVFPIILFIITIILLKKYVIKQKIEIDIKKFDSLEVAYLYNGKLRILDVMSLILHLANDGYIKIKNYGIGEQVNYKLIKVREYDKDNAGQKILFDGLFQNKDEIDAADVNGIFYPYLEDIRQIIENKKNSKKLFYNGTKKKKTIINIFALILFTIVEMNALSYLLNSYILSIPISIVISVLIYILLKSDKFKYILYLFMLIVLAVSIYGLWYFKISLSIYFINYLLCSAVLILNKRIPVRTLYGITVLKQIEQFKNKLVKMSENDFRTYTEENPNYFYEMIPYAIIFGIDRYWITTIGKYINVPPSFYESSESYTNEKLANCLENVFASLSIPMQSIRKDNDELLNQAPNKLL